MADDATPPADDHPLAATIRRAIAAHPILRDQKKLDVVLKGRRVHVEGVVFTRDMHRQLVHLLARIPGAEQIAFNVDPEIGAPKQRELEGRVPAISRGPSPSKSDFSTSHLRKPRG